MAKVNGLRDQIGDRMKKYEDISRISLMPQSHVLMRIDGKSFHTYTKGLDRPFDEALIEDMNTTAGELVKDIPGCRFAYVQSDEISLYIIEKDYLSKPWFDNGIQKMVSIASSTATAIFNKLRLNRVWDDPKLNFNKFVMARFDARVWNMPNADEVFNYFVWRQLDARRNSVSSVARSKFSQSELNGKGATTMIEMLKNKGVNWEDYDFGKRIGRIVEKRMYVNNKQAIIIPGIGDYPVTYEHVMPGTWTRMEDVRPVPLEETDVVRSKYEVIKTPFFLEERNLLEARIQQ